MRQLKTLALLFATMVSLGSLSVFAEDAGATTLTRAQWLKKIGACVTDDALMRATLAQVLPDERVEFTRRVLKAVKRLPVSPEEKAANFVRAAVACIASAPGETRFAIIAEVFADIPVEFLPVVARELARRFDPSYNKLSDASFEKIASGVVVAAVKRNAQTDEPSVRNTFVMLPFLFVAKDRDKLQGGLLEQLPDKRMRDLVMTWLAAVLNRNDYEGLLAAANVEPLASIHNSLLRAVGHSTLDRLLYDIYTDQTARFMGGDSETPEGRVTYMSDIPVDNGINRLPRIPGPYQNQWNTLRTKR